jgi:hypothetical protein
VDGVEGVEKRRLTARADRGPEGVAFSDSDSDELDQLLPVLAVEERLSPMARTARSEGVVDEVSDSLVVEAEELLLPPATVVSSSPTDRTDRSEEEMVAEAKVDVASELPPRPAPRPEGVDGVDGVEGVWGVDGVEGVDGVGKRVLI